MIDAQLYSPLAVLSTQCIISVGVPHWEPATVKLPDFHYAHIESSKMSGGEGLVVLCAGPGAEVVQDSTDRRSRNRYLIALLVANNEELLLEKRSSFRIFEDRIFRRLRDLGNKGVPVQDPAPHSWNDNL